MVIFALRIICGTIYLDFDNPFFQTVEISFIIVTSFLNLFCLVVLLYASHYFTKMYVKEMRRQQRISESTRSHRSGSSELMLRASRETVQSQRISVSQLADIEDQMHQMRKQIQRLRFFFYCFSFLVAMRFITMNTYESFLYLNSSSNLVLFYIYVIGFYSTETLMVLLICCSIQESIRAQQRYQLQVKLNERDSINFEKDSNDLLKSFNSDLDKKNSSEIDEEMLKQQLEENDQNLKIYTFHAIDVDTESMANRHLDYMFKINQKACVNTSVRDRNRGFTTESALSGLIIMGSSVTSPGYQEGAPDKRPVSNPDQTHQL